MLIDKLRGPMLDEFFEGILALESVEECYAFFDDLCTLNEVKALTQRYQVAKMLHNDHTYIEIEARTKASTATISRVKRTVTNGSGSYDMLFKRLEK
ncbi:YerC/YecD family TrpR-related protein [Paenibacillus faecalis]|uniref:YerC/YecD family TrpR-related protein n=1 Tax=Paenibacillus faecalis TaxID=2079532 RepID=UPI000D0E91D3|nr:YerC/YecD family TrpR-related protein [Paenibacillus faecalis]